MNISFIIVLFIGEVYNIFWMIFKASKIFSVWQIVGWALLSGFLWVIMTGYFMEEEKKEQLRHEKNNKS